MYRGKKGSHRILLILIILIFPITILGLIGCDSGFPSYEIVSISDLSYANAARFIWNVVINEPVTAEQLKIISEEILEEAKKKKSFNALSIMFYDYEEYVGQGYALGHGYTLGKADFAPEGDFGKANTVNTGEYDKMSFNWNLRNKDWSKQLTPEEVEVWVLWAKTLKSLSEDYDPDDEFDEEDVYDLVAFQVGMDPEEVYNIIWKQYDWILLDQ